MQRFKEGEWIKWTHGSVTRAGKVKSLLGDVYEVEFSGETVHVVPAYNPRPFNFSTPPETTAAAPSVYRPAPTPPPAQRTWNYDEYGDGYAGRWEAHGRWHGNVYVKKESPLLTEETLD